MSSLYHLKQTLSNSFHAQDIMYSRKIVKKNENLEKG